MSRRRVLVTTSNKPEVKDPNTVYLKVTEDCSVNQMIRIGMRMALDEIVITKDCFHKLKLTKE